MSRLSRLHILLVLVIPGSALAEITIERLIEEAGLREGPVAMRDTERWQPPGKIVVRGSPGSAAELMQAHPDVEFVSVGSSEEAARAAIEMARLMVRLGKPPEANK